MTPIRSFRTLLLALWAMALAAATVQAQAQARQRNLEPVAVQLPGGQRQQLYDASYALVIGASNYRNGWNRLPGVVDDVKAVATVLENQGFDVKTLLDPTRDQLDQALRNFVAQRGLREGNRLLVYFAGHGHTLTAGGRKLGYIVPVDAPNPNKDPAGFRALAYSMESIEVHARQIEARHALFVFDSCFSGTIFRTRSGVPDAITDRTSKPVRQFITAGDEDQTVPDQSIFRRQIERGLGEGDADLNRDGYITGTELGEYLQDQVTNYSRRAQTPRHGKIRDPDLDRGDFVFLSPRAIQPPPPPPPVAGRRPGEVFRDCADCPELVVVGAGSFTMGSPAAEVGRFDNEVPQHTVNIPRAFALGRHEVTVGEFKRFVAASNYVTEAERNVGGKGCYAWEEADGKWDSREGRSWRNPGFEQSDRHPAVCVSWNDAQAYVQWLGRQAGQTYRLPSEAEWEYAARAGSTSSRPWGEDPNEACRHANGADQTRSPSGSAWNEKHECNDGYWFTASVGSYAANRFGLYDMMGNVWEWVQDVWHDNYTGAPSDGSVWLTGGDQARRVLRGGSWISVPRYLRSAIRSRITPDFRNYIAGFRIARTL